MLSAVRAARLGAALSARRTNQATATQFQLRTFSSGNAPAPAPATPGAGAIQFHGGTLGGLDTAEAAAMETPKQMAMRWLDVNGLLTRTYSRRAWIMDMESFDRASFCMATEYERWVFNFLLWANLIIFPITIWYWFGEVTHMACKPPGPLSCQQWGFGNFKVEYDFLPFTSVVEHQYCKKCRWLEYECKKMCYDEMREAGFSKWGLDRPRTQTFGGH